MTNLCLIFNGLIVFNLIFFYVLFWKTLYYCCLNLYRLDRERFVRHLNKRATVDPRKTTCMLYLQADHQFFARYGTEEACIEVMTRHVQRVNSIYKHTGKLFMWQTLNAFNDSVHHNKIYCSHAIIYMRKRFFLII